MNIKRKSCWFHVLYLTGFLISNDLVNAVELISPGGTYTTTYTIFPTTSSVAITPTYEDYCATGKDNCDPINGNCTSTGHQTFNCSCVSGFTSTGTTTERCLDINECTTSNPCVSSATCVNSAGSYNCVCLSGYENAPTCSDIDECSNSTLNNCNLKSSICVNTPGSYRCDCRNETTANYELNSNGNCIDVNECAVSSPCGNSICNNTDGSYRCGCDKGYTFHALNLTCDDINECLNSSLYSCALHMSCNNTIGGYECVPDPGYKYSPPGYSYPVVDIDECGETNDCHVNSSCTNTGGSYTCLCNTGYTGNGTLCEDTNECLTAHECDENANCTNNDGSYDCSCNDGFTGTGRGNGTCIDIDECSTNPCTSNADCENTMGSYNCLCKSGYENSPTCSDINECEGTNNCHVNATCTNTNGSYACTCKTGFTGSGTVCQDRNECNLAGYCASTAICVNTLGNYTCQCPSGFSGDGVTCTDNNECTSNPCNQTCRNTPGSYECSCASGYTFSAPHDCIDIDECATTATCQANAACVNLPGSYKCQCNSGYLDDDDISEDGSTTSSTCIPDNFIGYSECPFIQNRDRTDSDRLIQIPEGIPFGGVLQYDFYVCINGMISIQFDFCHGHPNGGLGDEMMNGTVFAPFFSDIDLHVPNPQNVTLANRMYSCKYTAVKPDPVSPSRLTSAQQKIQNYVRATTNYTNYVPRNSIVATWYQVVPYLSVTGSDYFNQGEKATFQAVITSDGANTVVYYVYYQMKWSDDKGFPVMVGSRYNPTVSLIPNPPRQYSRLRFDKANFTNPNGDITQGRVSFQVSDHVDTQAVKYCDKWYDQQPTAEAIAHLYTNTTNGGAEFITLNRRSSSCGCSLTQAIVDDTFQMESNPLEFSIFSCHSPGEMADPSACENLNDNNNICFVQRNSFQPDDVFNFNYTIATRCCYKSRTGSIDVSRSESGVGLNTQNHFIPLNSGTLNTTQDAINRDIAAHRYCCLETPLCDRYDSRTRVPDCSFYTPPRISTTFGDPHIMSLDGVQYTFNGLGDYWLLTTNDTKIQLDIQARTCQAVGSDGAKTPATVFCGFAFKEKGQPTFEIYYNSTDVEPHYYVNGVQKPFASSSELSTAVIYTTSPSKELKFIFPSGTVLTIQIGSHILQSVVSASVKVEGKTVGLLGNVNGISVDDLISRFTGDTIPVTSNEEKIYYDFGQTWKVTNEETLFSMSHTANLSNGYQPLFWTNVSHLLNYNQTLINSTREFCGDEATNKECYFDFAVTGNKEMATEGKKFIDNSKKVISAIGRVVPTVTGPSQINVTKGVAMNFTIEATSNSTNLTYFIITNFTNAFTLLDARTGLVNFNPQSSNETVIVGAIDEFSNAGVLQVRIVICDCVHGVCSYEAPELLGNLGNVYNRITQCNCDPGYSGYKCESFIDACRLNPCFTNVTCYTHTNRSSYCDPCPSGFSGDGRQCHDIDDCAENKGRCEQLCINSIGAYSCGCRSGYEKDGFFNCTDINECVNSTVCSHKENTFCKNTEGSYECPCNPGYRLNSTQHCIDIDECTERTSGCQHTCQNTPGSYICSCNSGTTLNANNHTCDDINECNLNDTCDPNAKCTNIYSSHQCECNFGYSGNGSYCQDVDECNAAVRNAIGLTLSCEVTCTNVVGSYQCSCDSNQKLSVDNHRCIQKINPCLEAGRSPCDANAQCSFNMDTDVVTCSCNVGYSGNGTTCSDNDECATPNICGSDAVCTNTLGSYSCSCATGFKHNPQNTACIDINECTAQTAVCVAFSTCSNTAGSYDCNCNSGYIKVNSTCVDDNECNSNNGGCSQVCNNVVGGPAQCSCNTGYKVDPSDASACQDIDECVTSDPCDRNADCLNQQGTYTCTCKTGYNGDGRTCTDVNECNSQPCSQNCTNTAGSYSCSCRSGFQLGVDQSTCTNINECLQSGLSNCDTSTTECKDTDGSYFCRDKCPGLCNQNCNDTAIGYKCYCQSGFVLNGRYTCDDIDECAGVNDCHSSGICTNLNGTYTCKCPTGFAGNGKTQCVEIDECLTDNGGCHANATCNNTVGSFTCKCFDGFDGNGTRCVDRNECSNNFGGCHANASCTNLVGSHKCECNSGFVGNGVDCTDDDECSSNNGGCHVNATCTNTFGSFSCACNSGYNGNGTHCDDVNECDVDNGGCHENATCINIPGFRTCRCFNGFDGNGVNCVDRNECLVANGGGACHVNATCSNQVGSHECTCNSGFTGDGTTCDDVNECLTNRGNCHVNATCKNLIGSHSCSCLNGFIGDGVSCADINECDSNNGGCHDNATCTNTIGGRTCQCKNGFVGGGTSCTDINECDSNRGGCHVNATCTNTLGGRDCNCFSGFDGNGTDCVDRNECTNSGHRCHDNATCTNNVGGHSCKCKSGFSGSGESCTNVDECQSGNGGCDAHATCTDTIGSRTCQCNSGFTGDGVACTDVNGCLVNNGGCDQSATCTNTVGSETCACNAGFEGNGTVCYLILKNETTPVTPGAPPNEVRFLGASVILYDVKTSGSVLDIQGRAADIRNISSPLAKSLIALIQPVLLSYYIVIDSRVVQVTIYNFVPFGTGVTRRNLQSGQPALKVEYAVGFNVTTTTPSSQLQTLLAIEVNKTNYIINTRDFFGRVEPTSLIVQQVDQCTTSVATLRHKCHENAICTSTTTSYTCRCKTDYSGDGFSCKYVDTDSSFLVAIIATAVGLLLLIILLIVFLVVRKRKRDGMDVSSASSTSDVSWTPGVFGGMRARSMYTPAGVPSRQYTEYPPDDR